MPRSITEQRSPYLVLQARHDEVREAGLEKAFGVPQQWMLRQSDGEEDRTIGDSLRLSHGSQEIYMLHSIR